MAIRLQGLACGIVVAMLATSTLAADTRVMVCTVTDGETVSGVQRIINGKIVQEDRRNEPFDRGGEKLIVSRTFDGSFLTIISESGYGERFSCRQSGPSQVCPLPNDDRAAVFDTDSQVLIYPHSAIGNWMRASCEPHKF